jgi:hypothetical protein
MSKVHYAWQSNNSWTSLHCIPSFFYSVQVSEFSIHIALLAIFFLKIFTCITSVRKKCARSSRVPFVGLKEEIIKFYLQLFKCGIYRHRQLIEKNAQHNISWEHNVSLINYKNDYNESFHLCRLKLYCKPNISYLQNKTLSDNNKTGKSVILKRRNLQEWYNNVLMHARSTPRANRTCNVREKE